MGRLQEYVSRVRRDGLDPVAFQRVCVVALVAVCAIVVTGAAVRLTGSGLGCEDWPNCNNTRLLDVGSKHAAIEQINRLFTFVVGLAVVLVVRSRRADGATMVCAASQAGNGVPTSSCTWVRSGTGLVTLAWAGSADTQALAATTRETVRALVRTTT